MKLVATRLLMVLSLLAGCAQPAPQAVVQAPVIESAMCRVGPDGGPLLSERGIGGTGGPRAEQVADRGIGGTGIGGTGIGGTGIGGSGVEGSDLDRVGVVGVVTGFASICVDGVELQYDASTPVDDNGSAVAADQLRAGQLVVIEATGLTAGLAPGLAPALAPALAPGATRASQAAEPAGTGVIGDVTTGMAVTGELAAPPAPRPTGMATARTISIRSEVAGPIEAVELGSGALMIGGQRVVVSAATWGASRFGLGDWVTVSGLRQADGTINASRLDAAEVGRLVVRGQLGRRDGALRIGGLVMGGPSMAGAAEGQFVTVSGRYTAGSVEVTTIASDALAANPTGYFGSTVNRLIVQAFVRVERGVVWLNNGLRVAAGPGVPAKAAGGNAIVVLERRPDGSFTAVRLRYTDYRGQPSGGSSGTGRGGSLAGAPAGFHVRAATASLAVGTPGAGASSAGPSSATSAGAESLPNGAATSGGDAVTSAVAGGTAGSGGSVADGAGGSGAGGSGSGSSGSVGSGLGGSGSVGSASGGTGSGASGLGASSTGGSSTGGSSTGGSVGSGSGGSGAGGSGAGGSGAGGSGGGGVGSGTPVSVVPSGGSAPSGGSSVTGIAAAAATSGSKTSGASGGSSATGSATTGLGSAGGSQSGPGTGTGTGTGVSTSGHGTPIVQNQGGTVSGSLAASPSSVAGLVSAAKPKTAAATAGLAGASKAAASGQTSGASSSGASTVVSGLAIIGQSSAVGTASKVPAVSTAHASHH